MGERGWSEVPFTNSIPRDQFDAVLRREESDCAEVACGAKRRVVAAQ